MSAAAPPSPTPHHRMTIVSHSNLFYWWPVWVVCLILGTLTLLENNVAAVLPNAGDELRVAHGAKISHSTDDGKTKEELSGRTAVSVPDDAQGAATVEKPHLAISRHHSYGVVFAFVLLVVIFITNVPLRGMGSVVVIVLAGFLILLFAYFGWWEHVFRVVSTLDIRTTAGGYLLIGTSLLVLWLVTFLFLDRQVYIVVTPGNLAVRTEIGGGEQVYSTRGMKIEKHRSDLFRHLVLGLGSGDLTVHTAGAQSVRIDLPNVLFIGHKVGRIEHIVRQMAIVDVG